MLVDMRDRVRVGPMTDGLYCYCAPDSEPIVTKGPLVEGKLDLWYLAVVGIGASRENEGVVGPWPVRSFMDKEDAVALHDMIKRGEVKWQDAVEVKIVDGKRGLIGTPKLLTGSNVPTIAELHRRRR